MGSTVTGSREDDPFSNLSIHHAGCTMYKVGDTFRASLSFMSPCGGPINKGADGMIVSLNSNTEENSIKVVDNTGFTRYIKFYDYEELHMYFRPFDSNPFF